MKKNTAAKVIVVLLGLCVYWKIISHWMVRPNVSLTKILRGTHAVSVTEVPQGFLLFPNSSGFLKPRIGEGVKQVYQGRMNTLSSSLHQVASVHEGTPPKETRYEFSLAVGTHAVRNINFTPSIEFDCDRGILYCPNYPGQWAVASPAFRRQMEALRGQKSIFERHEEEALNNFGNEDEPLSGGAPMTAPVGGGAAIR